MGAYASNFRDDNGSIVAEFTSPLKADWITAHAAATGLAIVEVERLWLRFRMLQCTKDGVLDPKVFQKPPASNDAFAKNILTTMRNDDDGGMISFQTFCNAMHWAETTSLEQKVRGVFQLLNNGDRVDRNILGKILKHTYPDESEPARKRIADLFMMQMDPQKKGYIEEAQFVRWVKSMPAETVGAIMEFYIVPPDINDEAHRAFSTDPQGYQSALPPPPSAANIAPNRGTDRQLVSDAVLKAVAEKAHRRDWFLLANKLGFTGDDVDEFEELHPGDSHKQVTEMLTEWKQREGAQAYMDTLEEALRDSSMNDIAMMLGP